MKDNIISMYKIQPAKLKEARVSRGYSQAELGKLFGVTRQAINRYEDGINSPKAEILGQYIEKLNFPMGFFYSQDMESHMCDTAILFRSQATASKLSRDQVAIRANWMNRIVHYFLHYLEFPNVDIMKPSINKAYSFDEIEEISEELRGKWSLGMGPISNLTILLQNKGCLISRAGVKVKQSDSCSKWSNGKPFVFLTADKNVAVRSRFDLSHELGHLVLHNVLDDNIDKKAFRRIEREANHFAGAFLLPRETFGKQIVSTSLDYFIQLKKVWGVSIAAMIYRCKDLGILSENQTSYLWRQLAAKGMRKCEPLDDEIIPEEPTLLRDAVNLLLDSKTLTVEEMLQHIKLSTSDICELCNVSKDVFAKSPVILQPKLHLVK